MLQGGATHHRKRRDRGMAGAKEVGSLSRRSGSIGVPSRINRPSRSRVRKKAEPFEGGVFPKKSMLRQMRSHLRLMASADRFLEPLVGESILILRQSHL